MVGAKDIYIICLGGAIACFSALIDNLVVAPSCASTNYLAISVCRL